MEGFEPYDEEHGDDYHFCWTNRGNEHELTSHTWFELNAYNLYKDQDLCAFALMVIWNMWFACELFVV